MKKYREKYELLHRLKRHRESFKQLTPEQADIIIDLLGMVAPMATRVQFRDLYRYIRESFDIPPQEDQENT